MNHKMLGALAVGAVLFAAPLASPGAVLLTDTEHWGDSSGVWNNHPSGNWRIYFTRDPLSDDTPTFENPNATMDDVTLNYGVNEFVMYKQNHVDPNHDHGTRFHFQMGSQTASLTLLMNPTDYLSGLPIPSVTGQEVMLGSQAISITSYGWLDRDVYSRDLVQPNAAVPGNGFDDIGVVTIVVTPEPSTLVIWALGLLGLAWYARRWRTK